MAKVEFRNVRKSYAQLEVIHGVDAKVADGEFVVIVGPSGCGKSTLLRMVAGLEAITAGEIAIGDTVVNTLEPKDRDIAMVFQNYALYPHMSVYDNMAYGLKIRRMSKADIETRVKRAADILELGPLLERLLRGRAGVPTEHRVRMLRLIENMTLGRNAVGYLTESLHGAGSPQAQRVQIARQMDIEAKVALARRLAGIDDPAVADSSTKR